MLSAVAADEEAIDREQFLKMLDSESWHLFVDRLRQELERHRTICETSGDAHEVTRAQGAAKALRTTLALPEILLAAMRGKA